MNANERESGIGMPKERSRHKRLFAFICGYPQAEALMVNGRGALERNRTWQIRP
jgi:hypothetical protein